MTFHPFSPTTASNLASPGPFRIYRAPGSVAFLNCGSALQPILPRSQCWCIDEINSKFVLQIRRPNYWRIELPVAEPEDQQRAELLREVFDKILQFEKTECPFKRAFTVELPEPQTPVTKRPWTPVRRSLPNSPAIDYADSPGSSSRRASFLQHVSTATPLSFRERAGPLEFLDDIPGSIQESPPDPSPIVRTETAKLEAKIEAEAVEESTRVAEHNAAPRPAFDGQNDFQHQDMTPSRAQRQPREAFQIPVLQPLLVPPQSIRTTMSAGELYSSPSTLDTQDHQVSRAGARTPELQDEGSSSEDHQEVSPRTESSPSGGVSLQTDDMPYEMHEGSGHSRDRMKTRLRRTPRFAVARSVTLPPHLKLSMDRSSDSSGVLSPIMQSSTSDPCAHDEEESSSELEDRVHSLELRRRGSDDSFHSVQSWQSQSGPLSPPFQRPDTDSTDPGEVPTGKDLAENDVAPRGDVPATASGWEPEWGGECDPSCEIVPDEEPPLKMAGAFPVSTSLDAAEEVPPAVMRRRTVTSHRPMTSSISVGHRAFQPLPPPANFFNPTPSVERRPLSKLDVVKQIPMAIISKTCEMLLGPPSHLIALMLKVAAKILAGEWRGLVFGYDEEGEQIPVQWDYSEGDFSDWSDDEPHMNQYPGRHHNHHHHSHHRQNSRQNSHQKARETTGESTAVASSESSDDSRSWGVD